MGRTLTGPFCPGQLERHRREPLPAVCSRLGALARAVRLPVTTGVICPTVRIHPAIIAQAAATSAVLLDGRFALGLGSGEALNESVLGDAWPSADVRLEMLEEAVEVIRALHGGDVVEHRDRHYTVQHARSSPDRIAHRRSTCPVSVRSLLRWPVGSRTASSAPSQTKT
ncbi:MAG: LLM class flavin-dependent oxidoreductase [Geodermatophilaceae bacterium]